MIFRSLYIALTFFVGSFFSSFCCLLSENITTQIGKTILILLSINILWLTFFHGVTILIKK